MLPRLSQVFRASFPSSSSSSSSSAPSGVEGELIRTIHLAFRLAQESGRSVALALEPGRCCLSPRLSGAVSLGLPAGLPPPAGMLDPRWAKAPRALRVSPWHTATEGMWFLQDALGPLCMHLTAKGSLRFLRYQSGARRWSPAGVGPESGA